MAAFPGRTARVPYLLIGALALFWRLLGLSDTQVWRDEAITLLHTRAGWSDLIFRLPAVEDTPPLSFLMFKPWGLVSDHELWMRLLPVLLGTAWVLAVIRWVEGRMRAAVWPVGLLAAFAHMPVHYSQDIRTYSLLCLLSVMGLLSVDRALAGPATPRQWLRPALWAAACAHAHAVGIFVYPMLLAYALVCRPAVWRGLLLSRGHLLWLAAVLPVGIFAAHWTAVHRAADNWWLPPLTFRRAELILVRFFGLDPCDQWNRSATSMATLWWVFTVERVVIALTAYLAISALTSRRTRGLAVSVTAGGLIYLVGLWFSSQLSLPNIMTRTVLPAWTMVVVVLGLGAVAWNAGWRRWLSWTVAGLLVTWYALGWVWIVGWGEPRRTGFRELGGIIQRTITPSDLIISVPPWFEDLVAYELRDHIAGEQLLTTYSPVYVGRPLRHALRHRKPDPAWIQHWEERLARHRQEYKHAYAIYAVFYRYSAFDPEQVDIERLLSRDHQPVEVHTASDHLQTTITRWEPVKMAASDGSQSR